MVLDHQEQFVLIADEERIDDLTRKLMRIGLDNVYGYYSDIEDLGLELQKVRSVSYEMMLDIIDGEDFQVIDVRGYTEFEAGHIEGAENLFVGTIEQHLDKIDRSRKVVVYCQGGDRSAIGAIHSIKTWLHQYI